MMPLRARLAGENYAPFDWLLGTFAATEADFNAKFGRVEIVPAEEAGAEASEASSEGASSGAGAKPSASDASGSGSGDLRRRGRPGSSKDVKAGVRG